ncbi:GatB/YqeY domain-containing protein [Candidatus Omnitrophota bacterium]
MLEERIKQDYISAMKSKDKMRSTTLSFLRAQMKNVIIDKKLDSLSDNDIIPILKKQVKQRQDSVEQFGQGGRQDLVEKEQAELDIIKSYLPEEMSSEAVEIIVKEAIAELGASSMKEMGGVMKAVAVKVEGRADNRLISELVKKSLSA